MSRHAQAAESVFDYIVIRSGAGGGPVAARLAREGHTVALLAAGLDALGPDAASIDPHTGVIYTVPALAAISSEHPLISWDFFVEHYADAAKNARDSKFVPGKGIQYSRGSTLGGSTAHDAPRIPGFFIMIPIYMVAEKAAGVIQAEGRSARAAHGDGRSQRRG